MTRSIPFPRFRTKSELDSLETFLIKRVERTVENGLLFLIVLKLLARKPMSASEIRRAVSKRGFSQPYHTTLHNQLAVLETMKLIEKEKVGKGHSKPLHITEKGLTVLTRGEKHLKNLVARLTNL